jgi:hypothetical protein
MLSHSEIESTLQPANEDLTGTRIVKGRQFPEKDVLRVLTLMASIRTRALEYGWDRQSETELDEAQLILHSIKKCI